MVTSNVRFNYYSRSFRIQIWCRTRNSYSIDTQRSRADKSNILSINLSIELCGSVWDICQHAFLLIWNHSLYLSLSRKWRIFQPCKCDDSQLTSSTLPENKWIERKLMKIDIYQAFATICDFGYIWRWQPDSEITIQIQLFYMTMFISERVRWRFIIWIARECVSLSLDQNND